MEISASRAVAETIQQTTSGLADGKAGRALVGHDVAVRVSAPEQKRDTAAARSTRDSPLVEAAEARKRPPERNSPLDEALRSASDPPDRDVFGLTDEQKRIIAEMAARDREVRRHEQLHETVGGAYAGQASFTMRTAPDGRGYAVAGEVPIDTSPIKDDPRATIAKMQVVKAAALAPSDPSPADRRVAAIADANAAAAALEMQRAAVSTDQQDQYDAAANAAADDRRRARVEAADAAAAERTQARITERLETLYKEPTETVGTNTSRTI